MLGGQQGGSQVNASGAGGAQAGTNAGGLMQAQSSQPGGQQQQIPTSQANTSQIGIQASLVESTVAFIFNLFFDIFMKKKTI